jgi:hypothetical protein
MLANICTRRGCYEHGTHLSAVTVKEHRPRGVGAMRSKFTDVRACDGQTHERGLDSRLAGPKCVVLNARGNEMAHDTTW